MGARSVTEWTDATYNPWRGCEKVSPGCAHCYMFRDQRRYGRDPSVVVRCADSTFYAPLRARPWLDLPRGALVFACSWSDWFHEAADSWREEAWDVLRRRDDLTWQILTKRPRRIAAHLPGDWGDGWPHVWLGVSIENRRFVHRADLLRDTPAAVRFISAEPLLGPLVADPLGDDSLGTDEWPDGYVGPDLSAEGLAGIDWLITGGESGGPPQRALVERRAGIWVPRQRPLDWIRDLRDACSAAGVAFLHKQWGGPRPESGGRQLDGRSWDELPVATRASERGGVA
jgi:protein gp37